MGPKWETRCFWFEDDGTPLRKSGCPSGNRCGFTHPDDELWGELPVQHLRPPGYGGGRESGGGRDSSRRRRTSRYRSLTRSRSSSRHRSRERRRSPPRTSTTKSDRSSSGIAVTNRTNVLPTPPPSSSSTIMPPTTGPPTAPSALRLSQSTLSDPIPGLRFVSLKSPSLSSAQVAPPPPPPSTPPSQPPPPPPPTPGTSATIMPPPYPLPEIPEGLTLKIPPRVAQPSPAEKKKMWEERVKLFADVYQAKQDFERCEQMYKYASDLSQSHFFSTFTEEDKARHNSDLAELIVNRDKVKKKHDDAVERLVEQGSWPLGPPPSSTRAADEQEEVERRDIVRHVQELNETAQEMSRILGDIAMKTKPPVLPLPDEDDDDDDDIYAEDTMDVDGDATAANEASLPNRKRQRLLEGEDEEGATRPTIDPDLPTREELEVYRNKLEKLEGNIADLDDELVQYEQEIKRSFQQDVENKIEEYDANRKQKEKERRESEKKIRDEEMSKVSAEAEELENDVREVGKEVADVMSKIESLKIQLAEETKQRDIMEEKVTQVNERLQGYIQQRQSNVRTMQTLEGALKAYLSSLSQPSPPATPSTETITPSSEYILSQLQEPILQVIRQHLQPMLTQSRKDTETLVRDRNMDIVQKIWPRMELVSRLLSTVADKLEWENSVMTTTATATGVSPPPQVPPHSHPPQAPPPHVHAPTPHVHAPLPHVHAPPPHVHAPPPHGHAPPPHGHAPPPHGHSPSAAVVAPTMHPMPPVNGPQMMYHETVPNLPLRSPVGYYPSQYQWEPR